LKIGSTRVTTEDWMTSGCSCGTQITGFALGGWNSHPTLSHFAQMRDPNRKVLGQLFLLACSHLIRSGSSIICGMADWNSFG
jgi:hypothetical protein